MSYEDDGAAWDELTLTAANDIYITIKEKAKELFDDQMSILQYYEDIVEHLLEGDSIKERLKEVQEKREELEKNRTINRKKLIGWIK